MEVLGMRNNFRAHRWLTRHPWSLLLLPVAVLVAAISTSGRHVGGPGDEKNLRVRTLEIVDSNGLARMRLGAPLPGPVMGGKPSPRRSPANGIQINNAKGDEMGGLAMLDDGSLILCFDTRNGEATCMYVLPSGERGFSVSDDHGKDRALMTLNTDKSVSFSLNDDQEKHKVEIRVNSTGAPEIRLTAPDGKLLWASPQSN
jgi:hypothetical protein